MSSCDLVQDIYYLSKGQVGQLILWPHNRDSELVFSMCGLYGETKLIHAVISAHQQSINQWRNSAIIQVLLYTAYICLFLFELIGTGKAHQVFFFFLSFSYTVKQGLYNEHPYLKFMPTMMSLIFIPFGLKH